MDTRSAGSEAGERKVTLTKARAAALLLLGIALGACSRPPDAPPPEPAPAAIVTPAARTVSEARQLLLQGDDEAYEEALAHIASTTDDAEQRRLALALHGLLLHEQKRWPEAIPALTEAAIANPAVAPFLKLRIAEAEAARGENVRAAAVLAEVAALTDSTAAAVARLRLPGQLARPGGSGEEAAWQQAMEISIDELNESEFVQMSDELEAAGREDLAARTRIRLLTDYASGRRTEETYAKAKEVVHGLSESERLALATKLSRANRYDQALDLFATIPGSSADARAVRLRALFNSRNYIQLLDETKENPPRDAGLMLLRARAAWRAGRPQEFLAGLEELEKAHPKSREALEAKIQRAKYHVTDEVDYAKSIADLTTAVDAGLHGNDGEHLWTLGWTHTLAGRYDEALAVFDRYIRTYPDGDWKTNSLFWSAKIFDRMGRTAERDTRAGQIVAEFPFSWYAYRARELWPAVAGVPPASTASFPDVDIELASVSDLRLATVDELMKIDLMREAAREMKAVAQSHPLPGVQFRLADVYVRAGEPFKANGTLQRAFRQFIRHGGEGIPQRFWEILYPLAYWETIRTEAERRGLDPFLVASVIRQESGFEPATVSNAGAVGLMQIMPEEAARIAEAGGLPPLTRADLFDPRKNIAVGAAELSQKLERMNGNLFLAIAAYNAGEKPVGTWIEMTPVDDIDLFVESIPYAETRLYVKTVNRNRFEYRRIYEQHTEPTDRAPIP